MNLLTRIVFLLRTRNLRLRSLSPERFSRGECTQIAHWPPDLYTEVQVVRQYHLGYFVHLVQNTAPWFRSSWINGSKSSDESESSSVPRSMSTSSSTTWLARLWLSSRTCWSMFVKTIFFQRFVKSNKLWVRLRLTIIRRWEYLIYVCPGSVVPYRFNPSPEYTTPVMNPSGWPGPGYTEESEYYNCFLHVL